MSIKENLQQVSERIARAAARSGRRAEEIALVAVTKNVPIGTIEEAIGAGVTAIGENRVQEAAPKISALRPRYPGVTWHMIGHLQRNKVGQALALFDIIHSVDSQRLAEEIDRQAQQPVPILIEVNTSGEISKFGVGFDEAIALVRSLSGLRNLKIEGLMTVGPLSGDARGAFARLRELKERINRAGLPRTQMRFLSMGMSDDFEVAIEEGSNLVRIGRALFGERSG